ncbi:hypothetical protein D9M71_371630 [compost metagenome]
MNLKTLALWPMEKIVLLVITLASTCPVRTSTARRFTVTWSARYSTDVPMPR